MTVLELLSLLPDLRADPRAETLLAEITAEYCEWEYLRKIPKFELPRFYRPRMDIPIMAQLVEVQPMSLPSGLVFYMDYRYESVMTTEMRETASGRPTTGSLG